MCSIDYAVIRNVEIDMYAKMSLFLKQKKTISNFFTFASSSKKILYTIFLLIYISKEHKIPMPEKVYRTISNTFCSQS